MVDPEYTYVALDTYFKYNPNLTDRKQAELEALVKTVISNYNDTELKRFDGVFRYSKLLRQIDSADPAILNSFIRVEMFKEITPNPAINNYFDLSFSSPIYVTDSNESVMSSNSFLINGIPHFFSDAPIEGSNNRQVTIHKVVNGNKVVVNTDAGTIYATTGRIVLKNFRPDTNASIRISASPNSNDLAPKRNQLLEISMTSVIASGEVDTIAVSGSAGTVAYTTTPRHK
jgi:hypothetical protein